MSINNIINEHIVLPISDLLKGESVKKDLDFLKSCETWSREKIDKFQNDRLRDLIAYTVNNVPYYHDLFKQLGLKATDIQTKDDLYKIPIVDKAIMKKEGIERFTSKIFPINKIISCRSSGSTGEPFSFLTTKEAYSMNMAAKLLTWYKAGYRLGDKYVKIANGPRHGRLKKLQDSLNNCLYIPVDSLSDNDLHSILAKIDNYQPEIIRSYPAPLFLLARYRNRNKVFLHIPKYIMTTGSTLPIEYRKEIEEAFGCTILDSYSCEGNANVSECITHSCYHVTEEYGITEILDHDGIEVKTGIGRVVTTDLWNYAHPFIRYNTQDLVEVNEKQCVCENHHKSIIRIMGRECETLISSDGKTFSVHTFSVFFWTTKHITIGIEAYQVVKKKDKSVLFRLVINDHYTIEMEKYIIDYWTKQLNTNVLVEYVDEIPIIQNNKRRTIIEE